MRDKHLVPYRPVHVARTGFQIEGLKPGELPDEVKQQVREQGIDPDQYSFEGSDLERKVTNTGTNDAIVREFMDHAIKDAVGTLPAKTIIFAISHKHALELYKSFNRLYPDLQRKGLAKVIDSQMERAEKTLDDFKNKDFPRVAISVDMLDTGIDVPSLRNLVFAKPVFSKVKFWQMLGRGTRTWTDPVNGQKKADFLVIDHWDNFDYPQIRRSVSPELLMPLRIRGSVTRELPAARVTNSSALPIRGTLTPELPTPLSPELLLRLSWSQLQELIRLDDSWKRAFFENECLKGHWSVRQLQRQIGSLLYERTGLSTRKKAVIERARKQEPTETIGDQRFRSRG